MKPPKSVTYKILDTKGFINMTMNTYLIVWENGT